MRKSLFADRFDTNGFSLVELLVVMAVLGILATVVVVAIDPSARMAEARDAQRKSDLSQIADALEVYYVRNNGYYPVTGEGLDSDYNSDPDSSDWWTPEKFLSEDYLKRLPVDPKNGEVNDYWYPYAYYYYSPDGKEYELATFLENENDPALLNDEGNQPSVGCSVPVYEVGSNKNLIRLLGC